MSEHAASASAHRGWRGLAANWGPPAAFQSVAIVFSILLALALNGWMENARTATRVAEARAAFVAEVRANRALLLSDAFMPHHRRMLEALSHATRSRRATLD